MEIRPEAILLDCVSISWKVNVEPSKSKAAEKYFRFSLIKKSNYPSFWWNIFRKKFGKRQEACHL